jgi:maltose alpha-D-glucosyltransferase / alpha-amylase
VLDLEPAILRLLERLTQRRIPTVKTRIHGDYHLDQVLATGKDFVIANFEGDPTRRPGERRLKYCPFRDVAGMVWSLYYAAWSVLLDKGILGPDETRTLEPWARFWCRSMAQAFLDGYLERAGTARFVPEAPEDRALLVGTYLVERAVTKTGWILAHRPDRAKVAFRALGAIVEDVD